jgi:hypothetical protein
VPSTTERLAIELRAERARLIRSQHALAAEINRYYPRVSAGARPLGEAQACARAEANTLRLREIKADLERLGG